MICSSGFLRTVDRRHLFTASSRFYAMMIQKISNFAKDGEHGKSHHDAIF